MGATSSKTTASAKDTPSIVPGNARGKTRQENIKLVIAMLVGCGVIGSDAYSQYLSDINDGDTGVYVTIGTVTYKFDGASPDTSHGSIVIVGDAEDNEIDRFKNLSDLMTWVTSVKK